MMFGYETADPQLHIVEGYTKAGDRLQALLSRSTGFIG